MKKSVSGLVRNLSLTAVMIIIAPTMLDAQGGKADFTGTWVFNTEKSALPEGANAQRMGGGTFTVTQEANLIAQTRTGQDGTSRVTKYTLDGNESINTAGGGESKSTAKWSADGKTLTIVTKTIIDGNERNSTAIWSLIEANTLSILITRQNQNGEVKATMVYDKK